MLFKLLRIDAEEKEIELPLGTHMIGKGNLFECDNENIPFNLGRITVAKDQLAIEPLHQNKLFLTEKGSKKIQVLKASPTVSARKTLKSGDSFGLLRKSYWYEVSHCTTDKENEAIDPSNTQELNVSDTKNTTKRRKSKRVQSGMNTSCSESVQSADESVNSKRSHSPEESESVKKTKRKSASRTIDPNTKRERCIYGATCYSVRSLRMRHREHRALYSHPGDADWCVSEGELPQLPLCPLGLSCVRGGARHWTRYRHPPGARPPGPVPRTKANKCWRRHSVYSASDSDSAANSPKVLRKRTRARQPPPKPATDSEPEGEDPYATEGSDEWTPTESESILDFYF